MRLLLKGTKAESNPAESFFLQEQPKVETPSFNEKTHRKTPQQKNSELNSSRIRLIAMPQPGL